MIEQGLLKNTIVQIVKLILNVKKMTLKEKQEDWARLKK